MDGEPAFGNRVDLPIRIWECPSPLDAGSGASLAERRTLFSDPERASPWEYGAAAVVVAWMASNILFRELSSRRQESSKVRWRALESQACPVGEGSSTESSRERISVRGCVLPLPLSHLPLVMKVLTKMFRIHPFGRVTLLPFYRHPVLLTGPYSESGNTEVPSRVLVIEKWSNMKLDKTTSGIHRTHPDKCPGVLGESEGGQGLGCFRVGGMWAWPRSLTFSSNTRDYASSVASSSPETTSSVSLSVPALI